MAEQTQQRFFRLRDLGFFARLGVAGLVLTIIGGAIASGMYLAMHHGGRDLQDGLTVNDVRAHYHGVQSRAPLIEALEGGHPDEIDGGVLDDASRTILLSWLRGEAAQLSRQFDNLDLGADAPAEIMAVACLDCHSRSASGENAYPEMPLEYWDDVESVAISTAIQPVDGEILAASTHTHALGMGAVGVAIVLLALLTCWPARLIGVVVAATGVGLVTDIGGWWLTREMAEFAYLVVVGGVLYNGGLTVLSVLILLDLCMPKKKDA